jgi:2-methylcitrate dehydratase PrpD
MLQHLEGIATMMRRDFLRTSAGLGSVLGAITSPRQVFGQAEAPMPCFPHFPDVQGVTKYTAEFVVGTQFTDIPPDVVELGKKSILDGLGLALAGSRAETATLVQQYVESLGCTQADAVVIGSSRKYPLRFAAFANGVAIHVDDFDDTQLATQKDRVYGLLVHPTVGVLPAVLGAAQMTPTSGKELMLAYHVGVEVECKIAEAIAPRSYEDGFHSSGTCGVFGSAAGLAKLRKFDATRTMRAFGIAASHSAGLRENFGTMMKAFQAGHATESGVVAADFAQIGWTSAEDILEAMRGFFHAYGGGYNPDAYMNKLGKPWTMADPGVSIKPFPSGSLTHPGMTEMLELIRKNNIRADEVERVEIGTNHNNLNTLMRHHPTNGLEAKFSMEYCMAVLLIHGKAGLGEFSDKAVNEPAVQDMVKRVRFYTDPEAEAAGYDKMTTIINIHLKDGKTISGRADFGKGSPANPMSYEEVADKFRQCADYARWPDAKAAAIVAFVRSLEDAADMRKLVALISL